jgi:dihydroorotate dehydrogenase
MNAERAHELGLDVLKRTLGSKAARKMAASRYCTSPFGEIERFGLRFANPIGLAAGFDKNGCVVEQLAALGFGSIEVGTVTLEPQTGNEKPRLFRLPKDEALINRLGFNNEGAAVVAKRLSGITRTCVIGINIGRNKNVLDEDVIENYLKTLEIVYRVADYITINVSSPNTPNLRKLQGARELEALVSTLQGRMRVLSRVKPQTNPLSLSDVVDAQRSMAAKPKPLFVKIAPDLNENEIEDVVDICLANKLDGIVATNTTISREGLRTRGVMKMGPGGLSGRPVAKRSNEVIAKIHKYSDGQMPIIGVGGVFTAEDAFDKFAAGACLVQAYTAFVYKGPSFARNINEGLAELVEERGHGSLEDVIGTRV